MPNSSMNAPRVPEPLSREMTPISLEELKLFLFAVSLPAEAPSPLSLLPQLASRAAAMIIERMIANIFLHVFILISFFPLVYILRIIPKGKIHYLSIVKSL